MSSRLLALLVFVVLHWTIITASEVKTEGVEVGSTARLLCVVDPVKCGGVHNIKWYRGETNRVFVFSEMANISRAENGLVKRAKFDYGSNRPDSYLVIEDVQIQDEGLYKCEITYLVVKEDCPGIQQINFTTLVKPESLAVYDNEGSQIDNGTIAGPFIEDDEVVFTCLSGGGRPTPTVQWWNGTHLFDDKFEEEDLEDGTSKGKNKVKIKVSRGDLGVNYECRAYHPSLPAFMSRSLQLDVHVRPNNLDMSGVKPHVVEGTKVVLQCKVKGARPAANITWYNGTVELAEASSSDSKQGDGTYDTVSQLVFTATKYENEQTIACEASNEIMRARNELPLRETASLEVMYPPIVTLRHEKVTVNESSEILLFCTYVANPATLTGAKWTKDGEELFLDPDHYEGGTTENTSLLVKNSTRRDMGSYVCSLRNEVGETESNAVNVSVLFRPTVEVKMSPQSPFIETDYLNATLTCYVVEGNPTKLNYVKWFLNGELIKLLPDCNSTLCDLEPSQLLLENVTREFQGNYSCMGSNDAGWGPVSPNSELIVYYPPRNATLTYSPSRVVKRGSVTLFCSVSDLGRPDNTTFRWKRGSHVVQDVTTANWTIDPVTLETESNFTCTAVNLGGESESSTKFIKVSAPPTFIERLPPYYGALMSSQSVSITCRVECSPLCSIMWQKGNQRLDTELRSRYYVINTVIPPDTRTNDFESVQSTLVWNMTAWPGGVLDRMTDNANYTCFSTGNAVGAGVKSTTLFGVEYPPENLTVSNGVVNVIEGNVPEKVLCHAKAFPEASYQWRREGESEIIIKGNALILNYPVQRRNSGNYVCEAYNRHGNNNKTTFINVLYRPECGITKKEVDGKLALVCTALANPPEVDFFWKIKNENETIEDNIEKNGLQSILTLETRVENFRTYLCHANNSVGMSIPCEMDVTGTVSWWSKINRETLMILVAIFTGIILVVIIICIIIIIVCRRKRAADKCKSPSTNKDVNSSPNDALLPQETDKAFYENLPFHNMQNPQNKPYRPTYSDLDYADVDYKSYGPINYKAASIANQKHQDEELL